MKLLTINRSRANDLPVSIPVHHVTAIEAADNGTCFVYIITGESYHTNQSYEGVLKLWNHLTGN